MERFFPDLFLPPELFDPGLIRSQDPKFLCVGKLATDVPASAMNVQIVPVLSGFSVCVPRSPSSGAGTTSEYRMTRLADLISGALAVIL